MAHCPTVRPPAGSSPPATVSLLIGSAGITGRAAVRPRRSVTSFFRLTSAFGKLCGSQTSTGRLSFRSWSSQMTSLAIELPPRYEASQLDLHCTAPCPAARPRSDTSPYRQTSLVRHAVLLSDFHGLALCSAVRPPWCDSSLYSQTLV